MMGQIGHQQSLFSYTIKCKADVGNNTFVVQKEMQGYQTQYACLQFVPRDVNVVQWKFSSWEHYQGKLRHVSQKCDFKVDGRALGYSPNC